MINLTPEMLNNIEAENRLQNRYRYPENSISTVDNRVTLTPNGNPHLFDYMFDTIDYARKKAVEKASNFSSNAWNDYAKPLLAKIPVVGELGKQAAIKDAIESGLRPDVKLPEDNQLDDMLSKDSNLPTNPWAEEPKDYQSATSYNNNKDDNISDSFYSGLTGIQYPKKENASDILSGLKSLQDDYWNEISKLSRPTRKYANRPNDIPLPNTMDYNENYTVNPFKSVTDYTDNSYMNTLSALHPALAVGIGVSNMFANPMKQNYFREREEYNKAEEARRKNEELRYERARQKYLDEFDRRNRLQDEAMKKYDDEQAIYNTMYSDAKADLDAKREDANTRFEQNKGMFDVARQLRKDERDDKMKLIESVGSPIDLEDVIFYGNDAVKAAKEYNALREQLANSNSIPEEATAKLKEKARKIQSLMRSNINPVGSGSNERVVAYINNNNIKPINSKKFGEGAEQLIGGILAWAADNIGLHKISKEAYERINLKNKAAAIAEGLDSDTDLYSVPIDVLNPVVARAARAAGVNKKYNALVTMQNDGKIQDVYFIHKGDIVTASDIQSMNNKIRDDIKLEQAQ